MHMFQKLSVVLFILKCSPFLTWNKIHFGHFIPPVPCERWHYRWLDYVNKLYISLDHNEKLDMMMFWTFAEGHFLQLGPLNFN